MGSHITDTSSIQLRNVLISPYLIKNLLFVRQIFRDSPESVEFAAFVFSVKDIHTMVLILQYDSTGDLYSVPSFPSLVSHPFADVVMSDLMHQHLGTWGLHGINLSCDWPH